MARIRSIHPGIATDEVFAILSDKAKWFGILLWGHCDDRGVFEWKPVTLKMKIMPADAGDAAVLLEELRAANVVTKFTHEGREYGAVRNFCRFQRPKSPKYTHFIPDDLLPYVGLKAVSSPDDGDQARGGGEQTGSDGDQFPQNGETGAQMEEEGGRRSGKEERKKYRFAGAVVRLNARDFEKWRKAYSAIPDLDAELQRIDDGFSSKAPDNWFTAASAMLAAKHQKLSAPAPKQRTLITPLGVGG